jgi:hypothetical protein
MTTAAPNAGGRSLGRIARTTEDAVPGGPSSQLTVGTGRFDPEGRSERVAIAALVAWMCTVAIGVCLLLTSTRSDAAPPAPAEPAMVPQASAAASAQPPEAAAGPVRKRDRFDPPSLAQAKSEPVPGLRALAEFTHPALAVIGCGFWLAYTLSRDRIFAAIGIGILLGAICAGLSWAVGNARAAKRERAAEGAGDSAEGTGHEDSAADAAGSHVPALFFSRRLMILHGAGAALTLLLAALIAARV